MVALLRQTFVRAAGILLRDSPVTTHQPHVAKFSQATEAVRNIIQGSHAGKSSGHRFGGSPATPPSKFRIILARVLQIGLPISGISCLVYAFTHPDSEPLVPTRMPPQLQYLAAQQVDNEQVITNWSGTHQAQPRRLFMPESEAEVEVFVRAAHDAGQKLRVMGSGISPNGLGLSEEGMLGMALMDKIVDVNTEKMQVTVQAGCRVQQVADALKPYGLTLQNYASIRDQQIGGFVQVGAHGTGATLPPVDDQVVAMRLVTPAMGVITLSKQDEPELFSLAKVGLGALGVLSQVTLRCVPRHQLLETTSTATVAEVKKNHKRWLQENLHLRYMWIPYTDTVVVVRSNPLQATSNGSSKGGHAPAVTQNTSSQEDRLKPLRDLYVSRTSAATPSEVQGLSATQLRDELLALNPLNKEWVVKVNLAEAEYWRLSSGQRVGYSDEILGFDCGGQQLVLETCFPVANSLAEVPESKSRDIEYMENLLADIKRAGVPAPSPIEQRWTSGSSSAMSPAAGPPGGVYSWVGIIAYLPQSPEEREKITDMFRSKYSPLVQGRLMSKYGAVWHWAKLEVDERGGAASSSAAVQKRLAARFPVKEFNSYRSLLDPKNVLANEWLDKVLPRA
ncbi:hypothetical protein CEUSTIGMA_g8353.t1 [Chlamydomonas eustigma]|uniref:FAD-binding PCMH-type domain-containing protein n=1 Tax=Chlamydomonas eustigma TaxID=1157962 RepID=A0A250XCV1_9CHLO|nr:hypothetical protein CEUSTIGMA_g8353.t1 [Chlamydomonas eustigma]|eukprot:GAX80918.1 hypothetical protein CEUSTIGMA_g8353.t1 [Chlamydomonas eustigma]